MRARMSCVLLMVVLGLSGNAMAVDPPEVLPNNGMEEAVGEVKNLGLPVAPLAYEGSSNTLYGTGAGNSLGDILCCSCQEGK